MSRITVQSIFNNGWQAFVVERQAPGYDTEKNCCQYLTSNGCKCIVGHSIPNGHPAQDSLGGVAILFTQHNDLFGYLTTLEKMTIIDMQRLLHDSIHSIIQNSHDGCENSHAVVIDRYTTFAIKNDLAIPK